MKRTVLRFLTLVLIIVGFVAASSVLTALITSRRTDGAWKFAITLQFMVTTAGAQFLPLLFCKITKSRLCRADGIASVAGVIAAAPVSLLIFRHLVPVVAGVPFSDDAIRLLTAALVVSVITTIVCSIGLPKAAAN